MSSFRSFFRKSIVVSAMLASGVALTNVASAASLRLTWTDRSTNESGFKINAKLLMGDSLSSRPSAQTSLLTRTPT